MKQFRWEIIIGLFSILGALAYFFCFKPLIPQIYSGTAPVWLNEGVQSFYPRFGVEKHRFSLSFFLDKVNQLVLRVWLVSFLVITFSVFYKNWRRFGEWYTAFWCQQAKVLHINRLRYCYFSLLLLLIPDWALSLYDYCQLIEFYQPILLFRLLHLPLLSETAVIILISVFALSCLLAIIGRFVQQASVVSTVLFLLFQGYFLCFGKVVHTYTPLIYSSLIIPFLLSDWAKCRNEEKMPAWSLLLIQLGIASCYFYSGLEKILISGTDWLSGNSLIGHLQQADLPWGIWLSDQAWLCQIGSVLLIIFQLSFPIAVFIPKTKWFFLLAGVLFHLATYLFLGVGNWFSIWEFSYIFFFVPILLEKNKVNFSGYS